MPGGNPSVGVINSTGTFTASYTAPPSVPGCGYYPGQRHIEYFVDYHSERQRAKPGPSAFFCLADATDRRLILN